MANSFNISVKPEIAAVQTVVDANAIILTDVHNTDLPAVKADTADIRNDVTAIHDTDLPAVYAGTVSNNTILADIHGVDLPAAVDEINANEVKIDNVKSVADAIQLKTDAMPQNVRSKWLHAYLVTTSATFVDLVIVTGAGILYGINATHNEADTMEIRLTLDGVVWTALSSGTSPQFIMPSFSNVSGNTLIAAATPPVELFRFEFWADMRVEIRRAAGTTGGCNCKVHYSIDQF